MYQISLFNSGIETVIEYPNSVHVLKKELDEKAGQVTNLTLDIPFGNPGYNLINDLITLVKVTLVATGTIVFEGRVFNSIKDLVSSGEVYTEVLCESELSYLNDSLVGIWTITGMTIQGYITQVINNHNALVGTTGDKQFALGHMGVTGTVNVVTNMEESLNSIISNCTGGYLSVRKVGTIRYLDYVLFLPGQSADIVFTKNMKDVSFTKDVQNIANRIIPIGKNNLDITTVNGGLNYLDNTVGIVNYGSVFVQKVEFKDIIDATALKVAGQGKLADIVKPTYKLSTNILDLSLIGIDSKSIYSGTETNIICDILGFNETFTIYEKVTDLASPQNCKITLSDKFGLMTDRQISNQRTADIMKSLLTSSNQVNTFCLDGYINLLKNQMGAMADTAEKQQAKAIMFEDRIVGSPTFGCVALGTQGIMISDTFTNNEWVFRTFGTGKGFVADLIVAGKILGGAVVFDLDAGTLKITHTDGSYTLINADGFNRYVAGTAKEYHYLMQAGMINPVNTHSYISQPLGAEFANKTNIKVIVQLTAFDSDTAGACSGAYAQLGTVTTGPNPSFTYDGWANFTASGNTWIAISWVAIA